MTMPCKKCEEKGREVEMKLKKGFAQGCGNGPHEVMEWAVTYWECPSLDCDNEEEHNGEYSGE